MQLQLQLLNILSKQLHGEIYNEDRKIQESYHAYIFFILLLLLLLGLLDLSAFNDKLKKCNLETFKVTGIHRSLTAKSLF